MNPIAATTSRYIKLGRANGWAEASFARNELHFGHAQVPHELCLAGDWDAVRQHLISIGRTSKVGDFTREIKDFYTLGADCLWITFDRGYLWWALAEPEVVWLGAERGGKGSRMRRVIGGWRNTDLTGQPLQASALSSHTRVASYRQTLCKVEAQDYLLRRITAKASRLSSRQRQHRPR